MAIAYSARWPAFAAAQAAERQLADGPFSAVLLDLSLPDGQGLSAVAEIQAAAPDLPYRHFDRSGG